MFVVLASIVVVVDAPEKPVAGCCAFIDSSRGGHPRETSCRCGVLSSIVVVVDTPEKPVVVGCAFIDSSRGWTRQRNQLCLLCLH